MNTDNFKYTYSPEFTANKSVIEFKSIYTPEFLVNQSIKDNRKINDEFYEYSIFYAALPDIQRRYTIDSILIPANIVENDYYQMDKITDKFFEKVINKLNSDDNIYMDTLKNYLKFRREILINELVKIENHLFSL